MKNTIRLAAAVAALAAAGSLATAANAATASASASAEILSTLNVVKDQDLNFGQIAVNGAGTVVVGTGATPDSCSALLVCAGSTQKANFVVTGAKNIGVAASVQQTSVSLTSGSNSMALDNFTLYFPNGTTLTGSGTTGSTNFEVGGTLHVAAGQATGVYSGTFNVNVSYN
ncbi:MAG: DUF4402 domain-containing protein [Novosphingobium sp.]